MKRYIPLIAALATIALLANGVARAHAAPSTDCVGHRCFTTLHAGAKAKTWKVPQAYGDGYTLFLNIYEGARRLAYEPFPDYCGASYYSPAAAARLAACGRRRPRLSYVSFDGPRTLRVEYRFAAP
jgi:hypothetical protein